MEKQKKIESSGDGRRVCNHPGSPEFEFWMVRNPSLPQPNILTADELFVDGVLLPLDLVSISTTSGPVSFVEHVSARDDVALGPELTSSAASETFSLSRRWRDIFKTGSKEIDQKGEVGKTTKKRERKLSNGGGHGVVSSAELNINLWPFSRSRSAGTGGARAKVVTRKVSSAPCSRSNSGGESKSRKWPTSPARPGVHVGRSSPVWQPLRGREAMESRKSGIPGGGKAKTVKSCKQEIATVRGGVFGGRGWDRRRSGGSNDGSGAVNIFNFRSLFSKKVY